MAEPQPFLAMKRLVDEHAANRYAISSMGAGPAVNVRVGIARYSCTDPFNLVEGRPSRRFLCEDCDYDSAESA